MTQDSSGWIIVRVANKGQATEFLVPQQLRAANVCTDGFTPQEITLFRTDEEALTYAQKCKLGRPNSNLEIRQAVVKLEILP